MWNEVKKNSIAFSVYRKRRQRGVYIIVYLVFILAIIVTACSPKMGNGALKFFFDGVPKKTKQDTLVTTAVSDTVSMRSKIAVPQVNAETYYHTPYKEGACTKCHDREAPGKTTFSQNEFCYTCHTDYQKKIQICSWSGSGRILYHLPCTSS